MITIIKYKKFKPTDKKVITELIKNSLEKLLMTSTTLASTENHMTKIR